ncbi:MAG: PqqD family protein [Deltaproteobacteria bacterium]|nr:PqqD family protein [Deltaproteobacteria bacterium]MBW2381167.1 PqqD family protein [Deltaproteobacteria bacterium]
MPEVSDRRVPRRKDTLTHEVTDTDEVVIYDSNGPQLLVLNDMAAGIWLMIDGKRTIDDITGEIVNHVEAECATVTRDVLAFLGQLEQRKLIAWQEAT